MSNSRAVLRRLWAHAAEFAVLFGPSGHFQRDGRGKSGSFLNRGPKITIGQGPQQGSCVPLR
ncbi:hypothetical protein [Thermopirellula anaerolimosa]